MIKERMQCKKEKIVFALLIVVGVMLRYLVMTKGHNFDFDSYCIVGEIAGNFRNVYAETSRYNYGPIFLCIQGLLYRISILLPNWQLTYRVLMVSFLTLADLGIACFITGRYDIKKALLFFLNPVSIIITGYHNQFDNLAVFLALLSIIYYNEENEFRKKDFLFVLFLSLSLIVKHILLIFPFFILLKKGLPLKKRVLYSFVPPCIFLLSFVPFALQGTDAYNGIVQNVFLYKSFDNAPLLSFIYNIIGFPMKYSRVVFGIGMVATAVLVRTKDYEKQLLIYLMAMVGLSSAIANQYLVIPIASLIILNTGCIKYIYILVSFVFLSLEGNGLGLLSKIPLFLRSICGTFVNHGYTILAWILLVALLYVLFFRKSWKEKDSALPII